MKLNNKLFLIIIFFTVTVQAYETIHIDAENPIAYITEVLPLIYDKKLTKGEVSKLTFKEDQASRDGFYLLKYSTDSFILKPYKRSYAQQNNILKDYLSANCCYQHYSKLVLPIAEFSFFVAGVKHYYAVYPYIYGDNISKLIEKLYHNKHDCQRLNKIYYLLGVTLGNMHKSGLINPADNFNLLKSKLIHGDLHSHNIIITATDELYIIDIDGLYNSITAPLYISQELFILTRQSLPVLMLLIDDIKQESLLQNAEKIINNFIRGYCSALDKDSNKYIFQLSDYIVFQLREMHKMLFNQGTLADENTTILKLISSEILEVRITNFLKNNYL